MAGTILGTPQFMSPEQARGEVDTLDARSDIYSLGAILYQILSLRAPVTGKDAWEVVGKVARGEIEPLTQTKAQASKSKAARNDTPGRAGAVQASSIPASLAAVVRKAMALDRAARYPAVVALQRDIEAYQNGFATSAENAGLAKQLLLAIKRHKAASIGIAAVLLVGSVLGTKAIIEGNRAKREAVRAELGEAKATSALAELKKQAPTLRKLAETEAGFQRFESALASLDASLALEPEHLPAYWRRAWLFIGMNRLADSAAAIRIAQEKDPANTKMAAILPDIEKLAALPPTEQWPAESARKVYEHLVRVRASGETVAIAPKTQLSVKENEGIVRKRVREWLDKEPAERVKEQWGKLSVNLGNLGIDTVEPLRGLRFDALNLDRTNVRSLEPLRGMQLVEFNMAFGKVSDISPLRGMPLRSLLLYYCWQVSDLSALQGAPLETLDCTHLTKVGDFSPVQSAPLKTIYIDGTAVKDLRFLANCPVESLRAGNTVISDLSPLRGKPLKLLGISATKVSDLKSLRGAPITELQIQRSYNIKDLSPLLDLPKLEKLRVSKLGKLLEPLRPHPSLQSIAYEEEPYRPVADFWAAYDARKNLQETLAQVAAALPALGMANGKAILVEPWGVRLILEKLPVTDISGLRPLPIDALSLFETKVTDLAPLRGMRLKELNFTKTDVKDVSPLFAMPILEAAMVTQGATDIGVLRQHPTLKWLGWEGDWDKDANRPKLTTAEFWARYDGLKATGNK